MYRISFEMLLFATGFNAKHTPGRLVRTLHGYHREEIRTFSLETLEVLKHITFINLFFYFQSEILSIFLQVTHRLSAHIYKICLDEYITSTCLLILETLIQPSFLIAQILWKLSLLGNETSAWGAHLLLFALLCK